MHDQTRRLMESFSKTISEKATVLDVGSCDVNGTFKEYFPNNPYIGIDIVEGPNVDIVVPPYDYPFPDNHFDVVISGSCLEHVRHPWRWMKEVARVLKPGGKIFILVPYNHPYHEHPVDCWRVFPDGMRALFEEAGLTEIACEMHDGSDMGVHPILGRIECFADDQACDTLGIATK